MIQIARNSAKNLLWIGLLSLFLPGGVGTFADDGRDHLIQAVKSFESQFPNFSVDISTTKWNGEKSEPSSSSEIRRVMQWADRFYDSSCSRDASNKLSGFTSQFVCSNIFNAQISMASNAPNNFEIHTRNCRRPERFQPYAQLLGTLGFEGTLSSFLELGNDSVDTMNVEIGEVEEFENLKTQRIKGLFQLPGSPTAKSIELRLAIDHAYLPCWGQYVHTVGDQTPFKIESRATSFSDLSDGPRYAREISSTTVSTSSLESIARPEAEAASESAVPTEPAKTSILIEIDGKILPPIDLENLNRLDKASDDAIFHILADRPQQQGNIAFAAPAKQIVRPAFITWMILDGFGLGLLAMIINQKTWLKS